MSETYYYGLDWGAAHREQAALIEKQRKAEAEAAAHAQRVKWGLATERPWGDRDVEAANRAMRRS